ncbi:hypothetical protein HID58_032288 [Brassica napus]|uniref:Uncharacterized protein n=1 Tax=Brassica napus TaxID=3708 RepID=A0ABQ8BVX7_BRANA|nr:hypothetical protein HID58_032288 [Brassica napus]
MFTAATTRSPPLSSFAPPQLLSDDVDLHLFLIPWSTHITAHGLKVLSNEAFNADLFLYLVTKVKTPFKIPLEIYCSLQLEADRRRNYERKQSRADPSQQKYHSIREFDWTKEKSFRYNYGARRDPNHRTGSVNIENSNGGTRRSARERLSFSKEDSDRNSMLSKRASQTPRTEWRPVGSGSQQGASSKPSQSLVSHTPSPRPQREGGSSLQATAQTRKQNSGGGSLQSQERRSALERIALPTERIPLLQDGVANAESGRLQEVNIQYLEENIQSVEKTSVPSSSRLPARSSLGAVGGTSIPSTSRQPGQSNMGTYDASQSRSPIRTLSEDRVHVSLRLGPLFDLDSEEDASLNLPIATLKSKAPISAEAQAARGKGVKAPTTRKRGLRSPVQGLNIRKLIPCTDQEDELVWLLEKSGSYSTKSGWAWMGLYRLKRHMLLRRK